MKILVITDLYPIKSNEIHTPKTIYDFVAGWRALGHDVKIIKPNFLLNSAIRKKPFYRTGVYNDVENINYFLPFCGEIRKKIKTQLDADIVIAHMPCGIIFANKLGLPFIAGVHVSDIEVLTNPIYHFYFKKEMEKAYKKAIKIACRSDNIKRKFLKIFPEYKNKTFVAFSGIDEELIIQKHWQNKDKYKIVTCANLIKRKNVDKVILACENIENIDLTVIGSGKEYKNLKRISSKVNFTGQLDKTKVIEKMRESDIFILPSENETFGMVYLEAMASGCITVGLKNDGIDGIIQHNVNGFLTDKNNIKSTIENILKSNNNNEILKNSYETIKNYTISKACENYLSNIKNN